MNRICDCGGPLVLLESDALRRRLECWRCHEQTKETKQ